MVTNTKHTRKESVWFDSTYEYRSFSLCTATQILCNYQHYVILNIPAKNLSNSIELFYWSPLTFRIYVVFCESLDFMGITSPKRQTQNQGRKSKRSENTRKTSSTRNSSTSTFEWYVSESTIQTPRLSKLCANICFQRYRTLRGLQSQWFDKIDQMARRHFSMRPIIAVVLF